MQNLNPYAVGTEGGRLDAPRAARIKIFPIARFLSFHVFSFLTANFIALAATILNWQQLYGQFNESIIAFTYAIVPIIGTSFAGLLFHLLLILAWSRARNVHPLKTGAIGGASLAIGPLLYCLTVRYGTDTMFETVAGINKYLLVFAYVILSLAPVASIIYATNQTQQLHTDSRTTIAG